MVVGDVDPKNNHLTHSPIPKLVTFTHWGLDAESFNSIFPSHNMNIPKFSSVNPFGSIWIITLLVNMWLWRPCLLAILLASAFLLPLSVVGTARTGKTATWRQHPAAPRWLWSPLNPKAEPKMGIDKGGVMENKQHLYLHNVWRRCLFGGRTFETMTLCCYFGKVFWKNALSKTLFWTCWTKTPQMAQLFCLWKVAKVLADNVCNSPW